MSDEEQQIRKSEVPDCLQSEARGIETNKPQNVSEPTAMQRFLESPPMDLLDENGRAPTRDQLYDDDPK